jgi:sterol desaturase/sphingolipid hydroxylase (fatty acid hydroxylase superfamily)
MDHEPVIRLGFFLGAFLLIAVAEIFAPRRAPSASKGARWVNNLAIMALNPLAVRLVFPVLPVALAVMAQERHWGLLNNLELPFWLEVCVGAVFLDFCIYLQHVLHHAVPTLWRLHMVHHADLDFDVTTGLRFHPIEILVSLMIKLAAVAALGAPAQAVLLFEVLLNTTAMFNHSNIYLPLKLDRVVRLLVVTPDMHRVHHSVVIRETNSNYGFCLPWWDWLLGTYQDQPAQGHQELTIGLPQFRDPGRLTFPRLLVLPFVGEMGKVPINRH